MDTEACFPDTGSGDYLPADGFDPEVRAECWLVVCAGEVVPFSEESFLWPSLESLPVSENEKGTVVGCYLGKKVAVLELDDSGNNLPAIGVRALLVTATAPEFTLVSHALQVLRHFRDHAYCGRCGQGTHPKAGEWARVCSQCNHHAYPIISPCIIVAITRGDDEVLLVKHHRHKNQTAMHTLVAGFIEPGESAEHAVRREIMEETGLEVGRISYKYSQAWPFPHALMLGFHAEYKSGELKLEAEELSFGDWFQRDNLPELPPPFTISRYLVELLRK